MRVDVIRANPLVLEDYRHIKELTFEGIESPLNSNDRIR